jgi:hypothetical protein
MTIIIQQVTSDILTLNKPKPGHRWTKLTQVHRLTGYA